MKLQVHLHGWGLWKYICGPESKPPVIPPLREGTVHKGRSEGNSTIQTFYVNGNATECDAAITAAEPWMAQNSLALSTIYTGLFSRPLHRIQNLSYASEAWEALRTHYQRQNASIATLKASDLQAYRCTPGMDIIEWLNDMQRLYDELLDMDADMLSDRNFAITAINNLPRITNGVPLPKINAKLSSGTITINRNQSLLLLKNFSMLSEKNIISLPEIIRKSSLMSSLHVPMLINLSNDPAHQIPHL